MYPCMRVVVRVMCVCVYACMYVCVCLMTFTFMCHQLVFFFESITMHLILDGSFCYVTKGNSITLACEKPTISHGVI